MAMEKKREVAQELEKIAVQLHRQNSWYQVFMRGLLTGLGVTIGASVMVGIVFSIFNFVARVLGLQSLIQSLLGIFK